jgi:hypothetical protein
MHGENRIKFINVYLIKLIERMEPKFLEMLQSGGVSRWNILINLQHGTILLCKIFTTYKFIIQVEGLSLIQHSKFQPILTKKTVATASESHATEVTSSVVTSLIPYGR